MADEIMTFCALGQNGLMASALDVVYPEGKGKKDLTTYCQTSDMYVCMSENLYTARLKQKSHSHAEVSNNYHKL